MDTTMKLPHHDRPLPLDLDELRKRNAAARHLLEEWLADTSEYEEATWPLLQERLEAERPAPARKLFRG
jgi:outer membrane biogenesis lipoprotein LolB